ncbi:hypothetical protein V502_02879 [Pseudogymnoascus sp. VKM F-4520 (FW-2644)]|nr:hypothetical protein V502_02879 [Pseudogymnoascus sp. VKM F-4520 (FW-2644)]
MVLRSKFPDLAIPDTDILTYLFPQSEVPSSTPSKPIWIDASNPDRSLTGHQIQQWIGRFAVGMGRLGMQKGDVGMVFSPNHIYVPVAYLGFIAGGFVFSGTNPAYTLNEMIHQLKDTRAKTLLVHPSLFDTAAMACKQTKFPMDRLFWFSDEECAALGDVRDWRSILASEEETRDWRWPELSGIETSQSVAAINYSSGTTGLPKGVCISHTNLIANAMQTIFMRNQGPSSPYATTMSAQSFERWVAFLPLYHAFGQLYTILIACKLSIPVYILPNFKFTDWLEAIQRFRATDLQVVPPVLVMLSKRPETKKYDLSSLKNIACGAAPLSSSLQNELSERFGVRIIQGYGMTETTCGSVHGLTYMKELTGSVGMLAPNIKCKLVDEEGNESSVRGEVYLQGPNVCLGYWNDKVATEEIFNDGWLKTGDIATVNDDGWFHIVDRLKELIKVNGFQVAPAELEAVLLEHSDVADVAVVGMTIDDVERPRAYVHLKEETKGIQTGIALVEWMKERVARHKWLTGGVSFVTEIPRLASGKIMRKKVKDWAKEDALLLQRSLPARSTL